MSLGISNSRYYSLADDYINAHRSSYSSNYNGNAASNVYQNQAGYVVSNQGNTCTDGVDDGHIGFFPAVGEVIEGAGNGLINGIKGMFLDSQGNFSFLNTLKTVGMGAACIAFPAFGLGLCAVGAVTGGAKFVSNIATALNSKTDAEAKDAWENVGDGGLTLGLSLLGAKESYKAVIKSAGHLSKIASMKNAGTWEKATVLEKAAALGKDMVTSTRNNFSKIKNFRIQTLAAKEFAEANSGYDADSILENGFAEKVADGQISSLGDAINETGLSEQQLRQNPKLWNQIPGVEQVSENAAPKTGLFTRVKSSFTKNNASQIVNNIKNAKNTLKLDTIKSSASTTTKAVLDFLTTKEGSYAKAVRLYGYENVLGALEVFASYRTLDETI